MRSYLFLFIADSNIYFNCNSYTVSTALFLGLLFVVLGNFPGFPNLPLYLNMKEGTMLEKKKTE